MTIKDLWGVIKTSAISQKSVNEAMEGDVYENLNSGEHKYGFVNFTINSIERTESTYVVNCYIFYIDRLTENNSNKLDIWTVGSTTLQRILFEAEQNAGTFFTFGDTSTFTPFTEKFSDLCAGVYMNTNITILNNVDECITEE